MTKYKIKKLKTIPKEFWQNKDWYIKRFVWYPHTMFPQAVAAVYLINRNFPFSYKWGLSFFGRNGEWFWDENELKRVRKIILNKSSKSRKYIDKIADNFIKRWNDFVKIADQAEKIDFKKLSNQELNKWYNMLFWTEVKAVSWAYIVDCFLTSGAEDWLRNLIPEELKDKISPKKLLKIIEVLTSPVRDSFVNEEKISLLKIAVSINKEARLNKLAKGKKLQELLKEIKKYPKIQNSLKKHRDNYHWIENSYAKAHNFPVKYFIQKIIDLFKDSIDIKKELKIETERTKKNKEAKEKTFKQYKVSQRLKNIIHNAEVFTYMQDTRKQGVLRLNHFLFQFIKELTRRTKISKQEALYVIEPEIKDILLKGKINRRELKARIKKSFMFISTNGYNILFGKGAEQIDMRVFYKDLGFINEARGTVASPGEVQGKVRVLKSNLEISKFKKDEILVTNNTTPEFVPAMKKAKAIITEQGGITTHAAIISRELDVPCIIGVKDATRIFKTGYLVEVDTSQGLVKIIKK